MVQNCCSQSRSHNRERLAEKARTAPFASITWIRFHGSAARPRRPLSLRPPQGHKSPLGRLVGSPKNCRNDKSAAATRQGSAAAGGSHFFYRRQQTTGVILR